MPARSDEDSPTSGHRHKPDTKVREFYHRGLKYTEYLCACGETVTR